MRKIIGVVVLLSSALFDSATIADELLPYYALRESWALCKDGSVCTFIAPGTFLFAEKDKRAQPISIGNGKYVEVVTQDGVEARVWEPSVSKNSWFENQWYEGKDVIVHCDFSLSADPTDVDGEEDIVRFVPGDVYSSELLHGDVVMLVGARDGLDRRGYIRKALFDELLLRGCLTDAKLGHPRFTVTYRHIASISTHCGEMLDAQVEIPLSDLESSDKAMTDLALVLKHFELGDISPDQRHFSLRSAIGQENWKIEYGIYDVQASSSANVQEAHREFSVLSSVVTVCHSSPTGVEDLEYIEQVRLRFTNDTAEVVWNFSEVGPLSKADKRLRKLRKDVEKPFLFSLNSRDHYIHLMERISDDLRDRSLAGYFLARFNASAKSRHRKDWEKSYTYFSVDEESK